MTKIVVRKTKGYYNTDINRWEPREEELDINVGDFLTSTIYTDRVCYEVVRATEHSLTLRRTKKREAIKNQMGEYTGDYTCEPDTACEDTFMVRRNEDGYFRKKGHRSVLRPSEFHNGFPVGYNDPCF